MSWNQAHAPLLIESFPKTPRTQFEASQFGGSHNYKTKQTTFLHLLSITWTSFKDITSHDFKIKKSH
jgi:hypothetical protein